MKPSTILGTLALVVLAGLLLVSAASAVTRPDDRSGGIGVGAVASTTATTTAVHPNDAAGALGVGAVALATRATNWKGERDYGLYTPAGDVAAPAVAPIALSEPSGRDWGDYGVAAAIVALVALFAVGLTMGLEHRGPFKPVPH